ncbi:Transketolase 1 [bacterium HR40]|nr:Transketolase 1 [bacterium HR40]
MNQAGAARQLRQLELPLDPAVLRRMANAIRFLAADAVEKAKSGHPGMPMGMADAATVLWTRHLRFCAAEPDWPDRDRFVLSAGHGSMLLYALLHLTGFADMPIEELARFRQLGSRTAGHPEYGLAKGIETTTGPLGQGIATAVGMALAEAHLRERFGPELVDHRTYVIASDGDLMEGISHEACSLAGHLRLERLVVLFDDNGISIDGKLDLACSDDVLKRFEAYGWHATRVDGHDFAAVDRALSQAKESDRPVLIACRTVIGYGAPNKQGSSATHGSPLGAAEVAAAREALGWPYPPFVVPDDLRALWLEAGRRHAGDVGAWKRRLAHHPEREEFERRLGKRLPEGVGEAIAAHIRQLAVQRPSWATRKASQEVLEVLTPIVPELLGGSADLTPSNNTKTRATEDIRPGSYGGRYVRYGVREHGMGAIMNGLALHGGIRPYGGTFLIFTDYARPAIRLAAMMRQPVIWVATHDSIGLGEDGPTHQPVEQLASLRAIPNLWVLRPADAIETAECWQVALARTDGPCVLALTRQDVPPVRHGSSEDNLCARGGYVLAEAEGPRQATLLATGSEVAIALAARELLAARGIRVAVVSLPCFELFDRQDEAWRRAVLGDAPRFAIEAASPFGWTRYVASEADVLGMRRFGESGPYRELYAHFGLTAEALAAHVERRLAVV